MERILRGIMRYRNTTREQMVKEFQKVRDHPEPKAVFFTCMDSRMIPTRYTDTHVGDMFVGGAKCGKSDTARPALPGRVLQL
ncbi:beta carbonic anhydrase 1 isoform X2 [Drosophila hydei]|uniref:carbonic anhydrase n=1 Tax=Drosophila hydei TaxID=7224 RepID=A0A6J1MDT1_DROHY|nr:beta carbonic anhydrase 1 isoform X2 [Drosophila hydei]